MIADVRPPLRQRITTGDSGVVARNTLDLRHTVGGYAATSSQEITAGVGGQVSGNTLQAHFSVAPEIYFDLEIGLDTAAGWQPLTGHPPHLAPGDAYLLRAASTGIPDPNAGHEPIRLISGLNLSVGGPGEFVSADGAAPRPPLALPADLVSVDSDAAVGPRGFVHDFPLRVAADAEAGTLRLELRATDGYARAKTIASLEVYVDGQRNPLVGPHLKGVRIGTSPPPASLALVHVHDVGDGQLTLDCFSACRDFSSFTSVPFPAPDSLLASFDLSPEQSLDLSAAMRRFSQGLPLEVRAWLKQFVAREDTAIVFVDEHDTGVAWELVEPDLDQKYLGERARTGRWTQVLYAQAAQLELSEQTHAGRTAAYLDAAQLPGAELAAVTGLEPVQAPSVTELATLLAAASGSYGMAYVGVQGLVVSWSDPKAAFDALPLRNAGTVALRWDAIDGTAPLPLLIINANHSAHIVRAKNGLACGALRYVLGRVAHAYLGTVGAIRDDERAAVLSTLLADARSDAKGWAPAERLRQIRAAAAEAYRQDASDANLMRLLQSCMYVYYGHPGLRLALQADPPAAPETANDQ